MAMIVLFADAGSRLTLAPIVFPWLDVDLIMTADVISVSPIETSSLDLYHQRRRAVRVAGLIILGFVAWLSFEAPRGILNGTDELLTAERSREMLMTGESFVVHYNFQRSPVANPRSPPKGGV